MIIIVGLPPVVKQFAVQVLAAWHIHEAGPKRIAPHGVLVPCCAPAAGGASLARIRSTAASRALSRPVC